MVLLAYNMLFIIICHKTTGSAFGNGENKKIKFTGNANLRAGMNKIQLLSVTVGLQNNGPRFELSKTGVLGPVMLHGVGRGSRDITHQKWSYQVCFFSNYPVRPQKSNHVFLPRQGSFFFLYDLRICFLQVGLKGESKNLASPTGISSVDWIESSLLGLTNRPLTWYKAYFNAPEGVEPLAIDMKSMGKGQVWINGESIGRYWTVHAKGSCTDCNYAGTFRPAKCQSQCGRPTQRWYT
ncbi:putative beta-galactosidase [Helianthus annuus]|nr:putative beta-galactosidase [Helianthus annuus]